MRTDTTPGDAVQLSANCCHHFSPKPLHISSYPIAGLWSLTPFNPLSSWSQNSVWKTKLILTFLPCILQWLPIGLKIKAKLFHIIYKSPVFFSLYCNFSHVLQLFLNDSAIHICMCPWGCVCGCVCVFSSEFFYFSLQFTTFVHPVPCAWNDSSIFPQHSSFGSSHLFSPRVAFPLPFPDTKYVLCCSLHETQSSPSWHISALVILYSLACLFIWYLSSSLDGKWHFQRIFLERMNDFPMISYWKSTLIFILSHLLKPRYNSLHLLQSA